MWSHAFILPLLQSTMQGPIVEYKPMLDGPSVKYVVGKWKGQTERNFNVSEIYTSSHSGITTVVKSKKVNMVYY